MSTAAQEYKAKKLQKMYERGHLSKPTRRFNRCSNCGRSKSYIRYFGLCRICARTAVHMALLPGVRRGSW